MGSKGFQKKIIYGIKGDGMSRFSIDLFTNIEEVMNCKNVVYTPDDFFKELSKINEEQYLTKQYEKQIERITKIKTLKAFKKAGIEVLK